MAPGGAGRGGSHCDERLGLRCDGEGIRPPAQDDAQYAAKAERISALTRDLSELLPAMLPELAAKLQGRVSQPDTLYAYHPPAPCSMGKSCAVGWSRT